MFKIRLKSLVILHLHYILFNNEVINIIMPVYK